MIKKYFERKINFKNREFNREDINNNSNINNRDIINRDINNIHMQKPNYISKINERENNSSKINEEFKFNSNYDYYDNNNNNFDNKKDNYDSKKYSNNNKINFKKNKFINNNIELVNDYLRTNFFKRDIYGMDNYYTLIEIASTFQKFK